MNKDIYYMKMAIKLANKAKGKTWPNPMVGAVLVKKGKVIGRGYHQKAGKPHAEIAAIRDAKSSIKGATLYLNLEPCCHFGRTGPCADEVIKQGIKKVVVSMVDPNPLVAGKSLKKLRAAGIKVELGCLAKEAKQLNEVFIKNIKEKLPFVAVKCALSLDGKIACFSGKSKWITSQASRLKAKSLRALYDCVLVGVNTVIKDDPKLDAKGKKILKSVIDPNLKMPLNSYLVKRSPERLIIITSLKNLSKAKKYGPKVRVIGVGQVKGSLNLKIALKMLYKLSVGSVFVEGGAETLGRFFDSKLVDKLYFFFAPKIIGGKAALSAVAGKGFVSPDNCPKVKITQIKKINQDILIVGYSTN